MDPTTDKPFVALVGTHLDAFVKTLGANDVLDVVAFDTLADFRSYSKSSACAALALTGGDHDLTEVDIKHMLHRKTVFALFSPSRALLEIMHEVTNTPIDIPSLELTDEMPLLIYMVNDMVHIAPNNTSDTVDDEEFAASVLGEDLGSPEGPYIVSIDIDPAEQAVRSIARASHATHSVRATWNLDPPIGVIGFKKGTIDNTFHKAITTLAWRRDGQFKAETSDPSLIQRYDLNWYTDIYSYATRADPRGANASGFTNAGGVVYTLAIERGNFQRAPNSPPRFLGPTSGYCGYYFVDWNKIGTHSLDSSLRMISYEPGGEDSQDGTTHRYSIDFHQDMQMLENNGNSQTVFKAQYSDSFSLSKFQLHAVPESAGADYSVDYKDYYDHWNDPDFKTSTWWDPGVFEKVDREGWKHWIVREYLPADNLPIHGLTRFSSSVGKYTLASKRRTAYRAFKSNAWRVSNDDGTTHFKWFGIVNYNGDGQKRPLDLTWA